jgi:hypothetical protein
MEIKRSVSPMKLEYLAEDENKPSLANSRNTDSVKKRLPMECQAEHGEILTFSERKQFL